MTKVTLITFNGCQPTVDLHDALADLIDDGLELSVEKVVVPLPEKAQEMGLFGSPTILIDGEEIQRERRGPPGFY